ncbi:MAG TPA: hypothetical protein PK671_12695, partial [Candidatus Obscuribacter sp.]|nr:hypothetical protein [Candidatus Obscuribacter sp.]
KHSSASGPKLVPTHIPLMQRVSLSSDRSLKPTGLKLKEAGHIMCSTDLQVVSRSSDSYEISRLKACK